MLRPPRLPHEQQNSRTIYSRSLQCHIWSIGGVEANPNLVFICSILAILPLAMLFSSATEELANEAGELIGAFWGSAFGKTVEMTVTTAALTRGEITVVQSSMLGAVLSNILLCLRACLFIGGWGHDCQFNATATSTMPRLVVVASAALVIPAALNLAFLANHPPEVRVHSFFILNQVVSCSRIPLAWELESPNS
jgi:calcium/proton exchanger cax